MWKKKVDKKANKTINKFDSAYIVLNLVVPHPNFLAAAHSESSTHACRSSKVIPSRSFSSSSSSSLDDASSSSPPPSKLTLFLRVVIVVCLFVFPFAIAPIAWTGPLFPRHIISTSLLSLPKRFLMTTGVDIARLQRGLVLCASCSLRARARFLMKKSEEEDFLIVFSQQKLRRKKATKKQQARDAKSCVGLFFYEWK